MIKATIKTTDGYEFTVEMKSPIIDEIIRDVIENKEKAEITFAYTPRNHKEG